MHSITQPHRQQEIGYSQQSTLWAPRHRCALLPRALPPRVVQAVRQRVLRSARKEKADSTRRSSRAVPHPSTNRALRRLTSEVRRDPVYSTRYGRQQQCWEERRSATLRRGNLPRRRERHKDMSTLPNCAPQNKLGAASSGGDPPTRCAERSSAGARAQKGPNPTACGSGRESTTPLSPAAPGPAALS